MDRETRSEALEALRRLGAEWYYYLLWHLKGAGISLRLANNHPRLFFSYLSTTARSLAASPGISLAFLSIFVSIELFMMSDRHRGLESSLDFFVVKSFLVLLLLTGLAAVACRFAISPKELARLAVEGRRANDVLAILAGSIYVLLRQSTKTVRDADLFIAKIRTVAHLGELSTGFHAAELSHLRGEQKPKVGRCRALLAGLKRWQFRRIRLIEEMVFAAERELEIEPERLCGDLLHFSPALFRERTQELQRSFEALDHNIELFVETWGLGGEQEVRIIDRLAANVGSIIHEGRKRARHQLEVLENHALNEGLMEIVAARSASSATYRYAECLNEAMRHSERVDRRFVFQSSVMLRIRKDLVEEQLWGHQGLEEMLKSRSTRGLAQVVREERKARRLRYLFKMQKAYSGVWPHLSLTRLLAQIDALQGEGRAGLDWCDVNTAKVYWRLLRSMGLMQDKFDGDRLRELFGRWLDSPRKGGPAGGWPSDFHGDLHLGAGPFFRGARAYWKLLLALGFVHEEYSGEGLLKRFVRWHDGLGEAKGKSGSPGRLQRHLNRYFRAARSLWWLLRAFRIAHREFEGEVLGEVLAASLLSTGEVERARRKLGDFLGDLPRYVTLYSQGTRTRLGQRFGHYLDGWLGDSKAPCYIVTQGNSATVKAVLQNALAGLPKQKRTRIFVICFPSEGDSYSLEPRRIIHSLKFPDDPVSVNRRQSAILREDTFFKILDAGDSVLLLLGTEAIDRKWRFVHPMGLGRFQKGLREECGRRGVRYQSVVLAEDYKRHRISWGNLAVYGTQADKRVEILSQEDLHPDRLMTDEFHLVRKPLAGSATGQRATAFEAADSGAATPFLPEGPGEGRLTVRVRPRPSASGHGRSGNPRGASAGEHGGGESPRLGLLRRRHRFGAGEDLRPGREFTSGDPAEGEPPEEEGSRGS